MFSISLLLRVCNNYQFVFDKKEKKNELRASNIRFVNMSSSMIKESKLFLESRSPNVIYC